MPSVTMDSSTLTIHTRKYSPPLPVNSIGCASMFCGMNVDIGPAALSLSDETWLMNSLLFAAQCSSGQWKKNLCQIGLWRFSNKRWKL